MSSHLHAFIAMLDSAGIGYGTRQDFDPDGTAVQVEHEDDKETITDWQFDADGRLVSTTVCSD